MPTPGAQQVALEPPRAGDAPLAPGVLRAQPEDFVVEEELSFQPAGTGSHLLLKVRKRDANTQWVARQLAAFTGCRAAEVGYAGLKDRRAVAVQWFTVPRPPSLPDWQRLGAREFEVLEAHPHTRKLPRGALAGNRFSVRIRPIRSDGAALAATLGPRLEAIGRDGVPNYFGAQRFGLQGSNLAAPAQDLRRLSAAQRGFVLSAARALIFNAVLAERVAARSWNNLVAGDLANLDARGSYFAVVAADAELEARCAQLAIHPTGPLWGAGPPESGAGVLELESRIAAHFPEHCALCIAAGMRQERRSLRLAVRELSCLAEPDAVVLGFRLSRGSFATSVLRELIAQSPDSST